MDFVIIMQILYLEYKWKLLVFGIFKGKGVHFMTARFRIQPKAADFQLAFTVLKFLRCLIPRQNLVKTKQNLAKN